MSRSVKDTVISFLPISNSSLILTLVLISLLEVKNSEFRTKPQYSQMLKFPNLTYCGQTIFSLSAVFVLMGNRIDSLTIRKVTWFCLETLTYLYSYSKQNHEDPLNRIIKTLYRAL